MNTKKSRVRHLSNVESKRHISYVKGNVANRKIKDVVDGLPGELVENILNRLNFIECTRFYQLTGHSYAKEKLDKLSERYELPHDRVEGLQDKRGFHRSIDLLRALPFQYNKPQSMDANKWFRKYLKFPTYDRNEEVTFVFKKVDEQGDHLGNIKVFKMSQVLESSEKTEVTFFLGYEHQKKLLEKGNNVKFLSGSVKIPRSPSNQPFMYRLGLLYCTDNKIYYEFHTKLKTVTIHCLDLTSGMSTELFSIRSEGLYIKLFCSETYVHLAHFHGAEQVVWRYNTQTQDLKRHWLRHPIGSTMSATDSHLFVFEEEDRNLVVHFFNKSMNQYCHALQRRTNEVLKLRENVYIRENRCLPDKSIQLILERRDGVKIVEVQQCVMCCQVSIRKYSQFQIVEPHRTSTYFYDDVKETAILLHRSFDPTYFSVKCKNPPSRIPDNTYYQIIEVITPWKARRRCKSQ